MTFKKYIENSKIYVEERDRVYQTMCLVSDTANLLEKIKYFKNENTLLLSEIGDAIFCAFALMSKLNFEINNEPIDLEDMKVNTDHLDQKFQISEHDLLQSIILELGIISNIMTENMRRDVVDLNEFDTKRLKNSLYSYILYMLILVCKFNFSIDRVLDANLQKLKIKKKELNSKNKKEEGGE